MRKHFTKNPETLQCASSVTCISLCIRQLARCKFIFMVYHFGWATPSTSGQLARWRRRSPGRRQLVSKQLQSVWVYLSRSVLKSSTRLGRVSLQLGAWVSWLPTGCILIIFPYKSKVAKCLCRKTAVLEKLRYYLWRNFYFGWASSSQCAYRFHLQIFTNNINCHIITNKLPPCLGLIADW